MAVFDQPARRDPAARHRDLAWHIPSLFRAALDTEWVHWLQHLSFFASALLFWWAMLQGHARRSYGAAIGYLFVTGLHSGFLGILLAFSPRLWYAPMPAATQWGLTALEDQQFAGILLWIPGGLIYAGAALAIAGLWIARSPTAGFAGSYPDDRWSPHPLS